MALTLLTGCAEDAASAAEERPAASPSPTREAKETKAAKSTKPSAKPKAKPKAKPAKKPAAAAAADGACATSLGDSFWRAQAAGLPVHAKSSAYVSAIGPGDNVHPDFGSGLIDGKPFGIPVTTVDEDVAAAKVSFDYADESDKSGYRIPNDARVEGGANGDGDRHVIVWDKHRCNAYELYDAKRGGNGSWHAGSGAVFDLKDHKLRPDGWTSADAAGLAILPGLVRYDEVASGRIDHAIRMTVPESDRSYIWPARHQAGAEDNKNLPPMGLRLRLKDGVDTSGMPKQARVVAEALKKYGAIVADNGSSWYLSGDQDDRWDNEQLNALKDLKGSDFEAVDASGLKTDDDSGRVG
ncbi:hypothetical protein [Streptomyces sp. NPDC047108]|uniref:hypothetical protein n=1 Tax=Streptomyces sp. NPDC047108 TaxID=3155025 RepID=UPI0033EF4331